jgi:hypothetical protein
MPYWTSAAISQQYTISSFVHFNIKCVTCLAELRFFLFWDRCNRNCNPFLKNLQLPKINFKWLYQNDREQKEKENGIYFVFKELVSKCGFVNLISFKGTDTLERCKLYFVRKNKLWLFPHPIHLEANTVPQVDVNRFNFHLLCCRLSLQFYNRHFNTQSNIDVICFHRPWHLSVFS